MFLELSTLNKLSIVKKKLANQHTVFSSYLFTLCAYIADNPL